MLTAVVLFIFATAQPKGFAVTLILGVIVSMFTAVLFTRAILGVLAGFAFFNRPSLMGVVAVPDPGGKGRAGEHRSRAGRRAAARTGATAEPATEGASAGSDSAPAGRPAQPRRKSTSAKRKKRR